MQQGEYQNGSPSVDDRNSCGLGFRGLGFRVSGLGFREDINPALP